MHGSLPCPCHSPPWSRSVPVPVGYPAFPARRPAPIPPGLRPAITTQRHSQVRHWPGEGQRDRRSSSLGSPPPGARGCRGDAKASSSPPEIPVQTSLSGAGVAQDVSCGLTAPRNARKVEFPGWFTAIKGKARGPQRDYLTLGVGYPSHHPKGRWPQSHGGSQWSHED